MANFYSNENNNNNTSELTSLRIDEIWLSEFTNFEVAIPNWINIYITICECS